jgi:hypothetical protein
VSKITNSKHPAKKTAGKQITNKSQIPIFNDQTFQDETLFGFSNFGHAQRRRLRRVLVFVWYLIFVIWNLIYFL